MTFSSENLLMVQNGVSIQITCVIYDIWKNVCPVHKWSDCFVPYWCVELALGINAGITNTISVHKAEIDVMENFFWRWSSLQPTLFKLNAASVPASVSQGQWGLCLEGSSDPPILVFWLIPHNVRLAAICIKSWRGQCREMSLLGPAFLCFLRNHVVIY